MGSELDGKRKKERERGRKRRIVKERKRENIGRKKERSREC